MKKLICFALILLVLLGCLTACNFTQKMSGAFAGEAEATQKVEAFMMALSENRISDAKALIHPQVVEASDNAIAQINTYLAGRKANSIELKSININNSTGTSGNIRQEQVAYQVTLTDGNIIYLNVVYLSNDLGVGFTSFQLVLGLV